MIDGKTFSQIKAEVHDRVTAIRVACELEVLAPKLGNVHPGACFDDCDMQDFLNAAIQVAPVLGDADPQMALGERVLAAVLSTRKVTQANVNLGIILLMAPLAMADDRKGVEGVIQSLNHHDGKNVFEAIRIATPGGMKRADVAPEKDVERSQSHSIDLVDAMCQAADRDRIALQYSNGFADFFERVLPIVANELSKTMLATDAVVNAQIRLLAQDIDSLIARKCGIAIAIEAKDRAKRCLEENSHSSRLEFDQWLRADKNRRNPGTTADLLAAAIYWLLVCETE